MNEEFDSKRDASDWQMQEKILLQFERQWRQGERPLIESVVSGLDVASRIVVLRELVRIDIEYGWATEKKRVEAYLEEHPELADGGELPLDLIVIELETRRDSGDLPSLAEITERFPEHIDELSRFCNDGTDATLVAGSTVDSPAPSPPRSNPCRTIPNIANYETHEEVGRGAFATVYRARDPRLNRDVAIKIGRQELMEVEELRERMVREARAAARLRHPAIVPVFEVGEQDGRLFIVSEFVDGPNLHERMKQQAPTYEQAVRWTARCADALEFAHQSGIVHRDVKPANILMRDDDPLLADFGLAQHSDNEATLTRHGDLLGTPAFMSPEQARGDTRSIDRRSDVYSLGCVLYQLLVGQLPFEGTTASILQRIQTDDPTPPRSVRNDVPRDLETICRKCLEKVPSDRFQTAGDLAADLNRFLNGKPIQARPVSALERLWKWSRRHPAMASLAGVVVVLAAFLLGGAAQLHSIRRERDRAQTAEQRAQSAEQETTKLLAESYADAGQLAMQRGQFAEAVNLFNQSIELGHSRPDELRLKKVEAHFVLREFADSAALAQELHHRRSGSPLIGPILLWQGELALRPSSDDSMSAETYFREALTHSLSDADRIYVQGLLGADSVKGVGRFLEALDTDPFHHRARTMLVNMLVALGRLDDAEFQTTVGQQLFPEDAHFQLMRGIVLTARGDTGAGQKILDEVALNEADHQAWTNVYRLIDEMIGSVTETPGLSERVRRILTDGFADAQQSFAKVADFGLRFPPYLTDGFAEFRQALERVVRANHPARRPLEDLVQRHPEGMLYVLLGELQLLDKEFETGMQSYQTAVATPSLLRNHQLAARLGIVAPAVHLGWILKKDPEKNIAIAAEALQGLDPELDHPALHLQIFTQIGIATGDSVMCRKWFEKWSAHKNADRSRVLFHQIELEIMSGRHTEALKACDEAIASNPADSHAVKKRKGILDRFRREIAQQRPPSGKDL